MYEAKNAEVGELDPSKRKLLAVGGVATLSAAAVALLGGQDALAKGKKTDAAALQKDITILNSALGAEYEAVAAYILGARSGLLSPASKRLATQFGGHHKQHADALGATVMKLGGTAVSPKRSYDFPTDSLKNERDVLAFAAKLERGAVSAYLGAVPLFGDRDLARVAASILGDEAMHWAVLRHALGQDPVPTAFLD